MDAVGGEFGGAEELRFCALYICREHLRWTCSMYKNIDHVIEG